MAVTITRTRVRSPAVVAGSEAPRETVYSRMSTLLGTAIRSEADILRIAQAGVPAVRYVQLADLLQLRPDAIGKESTIRRRLHQVTKTGLRRAARHAAAAKRAAAESLEVRLTPVESERLVRIARVASEATQLFGDQATAVKWLNTPADYMNDGKDVTPMKLAETDSGARIVESILQRTANGMF